MLLLPVAQRLAAPATAAAAGPAAAAEAAAAAIAAAQPTTAAWHTPVRSPGSRRSSFFLYWSRRH